MKEKRKSFIAFWLVLFISVVAYQIITLLEGGGYKTQEILFVNRQDNERQIVFQLEDLGAFGSNTRTVEIKNYILINYTRETDPRKIYRKAWKEM